MQIQSNLSPHTPPFTPKPSPQSCKFVLYPGCRQSINLRFTYTHKQVDFKHYAIAKLRKNLNVNVLLKLYTSINLKIFHVDFIAWLTLFFYLDALTISIVDENSQENSSYEPTRGWDGNASRRGRCSND